MGSTHYDSTLNIAHDITPAHCTILPVSSIVSNACIFHLPLQHQALKTSWHLPGQNKSVLYIQKPTELHILYFHRFTADEALSTQVNIFEECYAEDNMLLEMPGTVDISSHEDMFGAVFEKARVFFQDPHLHLYESQRYATLRMPNTS